MVQKYRVQADALGTCALEAWIRRHDEMAALDAHMPISTLGNHRFKGLPIHAIGPSDRCS
jgi:hypothetical protein